MTNNLAGKLAILSRVSSDLAPAAALALVQQGMRLALVDSNRDAAQALASQLNDGEPMALGYAADGTEDSVQQCLGAITRHQGTPQVLITCPARTVSAPVADYHEADFRQALEGNLTHAFLWSKAVGALMMRAGQGTIVHITGLSGMGGWPGWVAQSASFGGIHNLVHTLAVEWAASGVRVNALVPGVTPSSVKQTDAQPVEKFRRRIPMMRLADDRDICHALLYLISPTSTYISGEILRVDGGWDIWGQLYAVARQ